MGLDFLQNNNNFIVPIIIVPNNDNNSSLQNHATYIVPNRRTNLVTFAYSIIQTNKHAAISYKMYTLHERTENIVFVDMF